MKKLLAILTVLVSVVLIYPTSVEAGKKSPTFRCTQPGCGAPHGGIPDRGGLCPQCWFKSQQPPPPPPLPPCGPPPFKQCSN